MNGGCLNNVIDAGSATGYGRFSFAHSCLVNRAHQHRRAVQAVSRIL